jgi:hypothetical protein
LKCCLNCFEDKEIISYIKKNGKTDKCDFCKTQTLCVETKKLKDKFEYLFEIYTRDIDFKYNEDMKENPGTPLWEKVQDDWGIFNNSAYEILKDMFKAHSKDDLIDQVDIETNVEIEEEYVGADETYSKQTIAIWDNFKNEIKHKNRFFPETDISFLKQVLLPYETKKVIRIFFRARIYTSDTRFKKIDLHKPIPAICLNGGRGNPPGISYLYLASSINTAISEVRPNVGDKVAVGEFVIDNVNLIDLRKPFSSSPFKYGSNLKKAFDYRNILLMLSKELARPILPQASSIEYVPTQYLCELIKSLKFDGILYNSSITKGYNVLLFKNFDCLNFDDYIIRGINLKHEKIK